MTPDAWWSGIVKRAFSESKPEALVAWEDRCAAVAEAVAMGRSAMTEHCQYCQGFGGTDGGVGFMVHPAPGCLGIDNKAQEAEQAERERSG